jgi:xylan 1,4-beta-xylosidase
MRTLGRQALLEPVEWTKDGWLRAKGGTLAKPLPKPRGGRPSKAGFALSDDFSSGRLGLQWAFHAPGPDENKRLRFEDKALVIRGKGKALPDSSPLTCPAGDRSYEISVDLEISGSDPHSHGGLALFYEERGHVGIGFSTTQMLTYGYGQEHTWMRETLPAATPRRVRIRLVNRETVVTWHYSHDGGKTWIQHSWQMEVSGLHHNVFGGFVSLRPALFSAGAGEVRARDFVYRGLPA